MGIILPVPLHASGVFTRITVLAGSHVNGQKPNHLGLTEIEYCWAPGQFDARQGYSVPGEAIEIPTWSGSMRVQVSLENPPG